MTRYLEMATQRQFVTPNIKARGEELEQQGLKALDALHIACAEATKSDYFLTCDKRLINRCQDLSLKVLNPVNFILEIEEND
jgi:predicted nucleic acid-binding protein